MPGNNNKKDQEMLNKEEFAETIEKLIELVKYWGQADAIVSVGLDMKVREIVEDILEHHVKTYHCNA